MKKTLFFVSVIVVSMAIVSCGSNQGKGAGSPMKANVSLDALDDFFTVKSYSIESNAEEMGVQNLEKIKGTLTIVVKRDASEPSSKFLPSKVKDADFRGGFTYYTVFKGESYAGIKQMLKMEPGSEETFQFQFEGVDPTGWGDDEEEKAVKRNNAFECLTGNSPLDQIIFKIWFNWE